MDLLVASNIALWIGFIAMAVINYALVRQIGVLYERVAPAGALMVNRTVEVGQSAPQLQALTVENEQIAIGGETGRSQLLFFMSPDCPVCNELTPSVLSAARAEQDWIDVLFVSDGDEQDHAGYRARKSITQPYVVSELIGKQYGVSKLPYAVLIDEHGKIASLGIVNSREHVESLFEAKERNVASIQDYLSQRDGERFVEVK
ncbi:redoxin [Luminiphilus syltensis NOR5-1B]|uniref:Redoxin n=1 Tax=Luminiphilus syltensis NOR5-1B TaxID=565045 RepID=B8KT72_9GAMM|nr:redoxin family protein [Luminiphilus syltensis]EED34389.1 redoxin [Luminiphilus syltensis NOR5-1B]